MNGVEAARRMAFDRHGAGRPLLLVHGLGSNRRTWEPVLPMLSAQRELIAVDLPGFGESPALPGEVTIAALTDAVEAFLAHHDLGAIDVVGSSMGARMVLELARRGHPGSVVALDPGGFWTDRQVKIFHVTIGSSIALVRRIQPLLPVLSRSRAGRTALLLQFSARPWRLPPELVLRELRSIARSPGTDAALRALVYGPKQRGAQLHSLKSRVTIGWGEHDRVTAASQAQRALESFPDATLHWFADCGHFPHWDQPHQAARLILEATGPTAAQLGP